jgi:predicted DNA-binding protein (MmcQ/YjbR family)
LHDSFAALNDATVRRAMKRLTVSPARLKQLRAICLALPEASEKVAWGDPTFRVRDKIFAMQKGNYEGGRPSLWLKLGPGGQQHLVRSQPALYFVPPYVGSKGWVGVWLDRPSLPRARLAELVAESYQLIAPKSLAGRVRPTRAKPKPKGAAAKRARRDA